MAKKMTKDETIKSLKRELRKAKGHIDICHEFLDIAADEYKALMKRYERLLPEDLYDYAVGC